MADLSQLSDAQLDQLIQAKGQPSADLSSLSDEQLDSLIKSKQTSTGQEIARPFLRTAKSMVAGVVGGAADLAALAAEAPVYAGYKGMQAITGDKTPYKPIFAKTSVTDAIKNKFDEATGGLTKPRNELEKFLEIPEEILGGVAAPAAISKVGKAVTALAPKKLLQKVTGITPKSQETLKAFEEAGVNPRLSDITQGQTTKTFQNLLGNFPGSRGVIEKATQQQVDNITKQLAGITKSSGGTTQETGKVIQTGAENVKGVLDRRIDKLYNDLDQFIPKGKITPEGVSQEIKIPTQNLQKIAADPSIQDVVAVGSGDTGKVLNRFTQIVDKEGQISYPRLKIFRSTIGNKLSSPSLLGDERASLKKIYGALSEDMKAAVAAQGGEKGLQAFNKANNAFARYTDAIETKINPIIEAKTPEAVYSMAMSGSKQGGSNIRGIMKTLDPQQKDFVQGTITRRMGLESAGGQDATGEVFNPSKFLNEWTKLSPEAKANIYNKSQIQAVNNLNKVISTIKESSKARQSSNNLPYLSWLGLGVLGGSTGVVPALATVGGAHITSKMMTNPKFLNWLAKAPSTKASEIPKHLKLLSGIAASNPSIQEDILDYLDSITSDANAGETERKTSEMLPNDISDAELKNLQALQDQERKKYPSLYINKSRPSEQNYGGN